MATTGPYRTQDDLIRLALAKLGVLVAGQNPDTEDYNYVLQEIDSIFRKLDALDIVSIPDPNNIPALWFEDVGSIVAGECAEKFGVMPDDYARLKNSGLGGIQGIDVGFGAAAKSLRMMNRNRYTGEVLETEYF